MTSAGGEPSAWVRWGDPMAVGLRDAPATRPAPDRSGKTWFRGRVTMTLVVVVALMAIALGAWVLLSALAGGPAVTAGESSFAVRAFAINRFGYGAARLPWYDGGLAALQIAGYETVSGALSRSATAVTAAREATGVAAVLAAVALTIGARRLRLSGPAVVAVPVLFSLAPIALLLHRTTDPAQLGVLWACVALALAAGEARRIGTAIGSVAYLVAAVVTAPLVLVALVPLVTMLLWSGSLGRFDRRGRVLAAGAGAAVFAGLVALAVRGDLGGGPAALPRLTALDWVLVVLAVGAGLVGLRVRWLRPLAVALLATAGTAAVAPDGRGSLVLVALPLGAVVLPAAVETVVAAADARQAAWFPGQAAVVGMLAVAATLLWVPSADRLRRPADAPARAAVDDARAWVLTNLPSRPKLVLDDVLWASLVDAGYPADQLAAAGGLGPDRPAWPQGWADAGYAVGRDAVLVDAADLVGAARHNSTPVAAFGTGTDQVTIRRVVADPDATATTKREAAGRIGAGEGLAVNPNLDLAAGPALLLRRGQVDARVLSVLAAITGEHTLRIVDFPVVPGEDEAAPRRLIAVSAIDNRNAAAGSTGVTLLDQWLRAQQPPFRPAGTQVTRIGTADVLLVRYDALGGTGLLPP